MTKTIVFGEKSKLASHLIPVLGTTIKRGIISSVPPAITITREIDRFYISTLS